MLHSKLKLAKMAEKNIIAEYAKYLQQMNLLLQNGKELIEPKRQESLLLSYDQFKDFFILKLIGKDSFLDTIVQDYQQKLLANI